MAFKNIFLSDDDADDRYLFKKAFDEVCSDHTLIMFDSNAALLQKLKAPGTKVPNILFIDLNMPSLNGVECLQIISEMPELDKTKIVIYSTIQSETFIKEVHELGATYFIKKPYDFYKLSHLIKYVVDEDTDTDGQTAPEEFVLSFDSIKGKYFN